MATTVLVTAGTTVSIPSDWNIASNTVSVIGAGGGGGSPNGSAGGDGGGGGGFSSITNYSTTPGGTVLCQIGVGGAGAANGTSAATAGTSTWLGSTSTVLAQGAPGQSGAALGVGTVKRKGGDGGSGGSTNRAGGGGGAGGNVADGTNGGGTANSNGGAGNPPAGGAGGAGGNPPTAGAAGTEFGSAGSGGGGGGSRASNVNGANGGLYGGGGGGGGGGTAVGGDGAQGAIVLVYTAIRYAALSATLAAATLSGAALAPITGGMTKTLAATTISSAALADASMAMAKTLDAVAISAAAVNIDHADLGVTLGGIGISAAATDPIAAALAKTLADTTSLAAGGISNSAALAKTMAGATLVTAGGPIASASAAATLSISLTAVGSDPLAAVLSKSLDPATLLGLTVVDARFADLGKTLGAATLAGAAADPATGALAKTFDPVVAPRNKCTNFNANPTATTGVTVVGAGVLSIVSDPALIAASGLSGVCTTGSLYKLDNSASGAASYVTVSGATGNTNVHIYSAFISGTSGAIYPNDTGTGNLTFGASATLTRRSSQAVVAPGVASRGMIRVDAGGVVYFILNQLEEASTVGPVVVTQGAAAGGLLATDPVGATLSKALDDIIGRLNLCANYNAAPTDFTGLDLGGIASGIITVVDDTAALTEAGLIGLCPSGKVYKVDNSASGVASEVRIGLVANVGVHTASAYVRGAGPTDSAIGLSQSGRTNFTPSSAYARRSGAATPIDTSRRLSILVSAGSVIYFILNSLVEGAGIGGVTVVAGAPAYGPNAAATNVTHTILAQTVGGLTLSSVGNLPIVAQLGRTNWLLNSTFSGLTNGTIPTGYGFFPTLVGGITGGLTPTYAYGTDANGNAFTDIAFTGTPTAATYVIRMGAAASSMPSVLGQVSAVSADLSAPGAMTGALATGIGMWGINDLGTQFESSDVPITLTATPTRFSRQATQANASTLRMQPVVYFTATIGVAVNATIRIARPQIERGALSGKYEPTGLTLNNAGVLAASLSAAASVALTGNLSVTLGATYGLRNKQANFNAAPVATTGVTSASLVNDAAALAASPETAGMLAAGVLNGNVFEYDNTGGGGNVYAVISGAFGNLNPHSYAIYARSVSGTIGSLMTESATGVVALPAIDGMYHRVKVENFTPGDANDRIRVKFSPTTRARFILNQLVEGPSVGPPIIVAGAAANGPGAAASALMNATVVRTLDPITFVGAALNVTHATLAKTLDALTLIGVAQDQVVAGLAKSLAAITISSGGLAVNTANLSLVLDGYTLASAAKALNPAVLSKTLGAVEILSGGGPISQGGLTVQLAAVSLFGFTHVRRLRRPMFILR